METEEGAYPGIFPPRTAACRTHTHTYKCTKLHTTLYIEVRCLWCWRPSDQPFHLGKRGSKESHGRLYKWTFFKMLATRLSFFTFDFLPSYFLRKHAGAQWLYEKTLGHISN